jgi:ribosomal protein L17
VPTLAEKLQSFMDELAIDAVEERVVEYVIREVQNGRKLSEALKDPYVKNRLSDEKLAKVLEAPEVVNALEAQIAESFKKREFGF